MSTLHSKKLASKDKTDESVLVGVLKNSRDLELLLREKWYRIPLAYFPSRPFKYLAFYQPAIFGKSGKQIKYYAEVLSMEKVKRAILLPVERDHSRAQDDYFKIEVSDIYKLPHPVKNIIPRRISFGFTTLARLLSAGDILELYDVTKTEQMIAIRLQELQIPAIEQYTISLHKSRYRLDLAILCKSGCIAIECDNRKAHSSKSQILKDKAKDRILTKNGWKVVRLKESEIISNIEKAIIRVQKIYNKLEGRDSKS